MDKYSDFRKDINKNIGDDFIDFGTDRNAQIFEPDEDEYKDFSMDEFINLPHFDELPNCLNLIAALKSNDTIVIEKVNEDDILVYDVNNSTCTVKYADIEVTFDKNELIAKLKDKASLMEKVSERRKPKKLDKNADNFGLSNSIKKFKEMFKINKVEQKPELKSSDNYSHEHTDGDITKVQ